MSAIAGILGFHGAPDHARLIDILGNALRHRGPGGLRYFTEGPVSLVHGALQATPESIGEHQPMREPEGRYTLVFDGRIDNRAELIAATGLPPQAARSPDSALVLAAFERWGEDAPEHLLGDFTFAVWDAARGVLFCARDPVGAGSFCFAKTDQFFAFASESEALAHLPEISSRPNERYIAHILVPEYSNYGDRRSWLGEIKALMPGESARISPDGTVSIQRYWNPDLSGNRKYRSYHEAEEHFVSVFRTAVEDRMRSDGDIAMMLSGGLDSAGVLAMNRRVAACSGGAFVHAYSAIDDHADSCIESRSILSLARHNGAGLKTVSVPSMSGMVDADDLNHAAWNNAHPVMNAILLPQLMCLAAARDGHKVMLHGAGGDVAMQVPRFYPSQLIRQGRLQSAWRESRDASANNLFLQDKAPVWVFLQSALRAATPPRMIQPYQRWKFNRTLLSLDGTLIHPEFASRLNLRERMLDEFHDEQRRRLADPRKLHIERTMESICSGLSGFGMAAGRHGVEARDPWSDLRVLDFMFRVPDEYKTRHGWTKYLVRTAFQREIEPFVRERKDKTHVGWKMVTRALDVAHSRLCTLIDDDLSDVEAYVDVPRFRKLAGPFVRNKDQSSYLQVFEVLTLHLWLNRISTL